MCSECLFGSDLLVAPVLKPGITARQVYLPSGAWYDWHTDEVVVGPRYLRAEVTMDRIPLFARGGAVIPMWTEAPASTAGYQPTAVELHLFIPVADGTYRSALQEDDGTTFAANAGTRLGTSFEVTRVGRQITVSAEVDGDGYESFARDQFQIVVHGAVADAVVVDGTPQVLAHGRITLPNDAGVSPSNSRRREISPVESFGVPRSAPRTQAFYCGLVRQARSKGRRQACGAISWWIALGPHEPGA